MAMACHPRRRQKIYLADKYARTKEYHCLIPGCTRKAINCHSVPRASLVEALAVDRHVYTQPESITDVIYWKSSRDPMQIQRIGINKAGIFRGFCSEHDRMLFSPTEIFTRKWSAIAISFHLRSTATEYCRKRFVRDIHRKMAELEDNPRVKEHYQKSADEFNLYMEIQEKSYLGAILALVCKQNYVDQVDYAFIPFTSNLGVSCCGTFQSKDNDLTSCLCYNLISYKDRSILVLTAFRYKVDHLDDFLAQYRRNKGDKNRIEDVERLVNDVAFLHCEEPIMSPRLWLSLTERQQLDIRYCLRHPFYRIEKIAPRIIKICSADILRPPSNTITLQEWFFRA
jgi:hypothetical protein